MTRLVRCTPLLLLLACTRPVAGRDVGDTFLTDLVVDPQFIRADVPVRLSFRAVGTAPTTVTYELGNGVTQECAPEREGDRLVCTNPGLTIGDYTQGNNVALVAAVDEDGKRSVATAPITIDFDCPQFLALTVTPRIARADETAVVTIEASEPLGATPRVTRAGRSWDQIQMRGPASYAVSRPITSADPSSFEDIVVRIVDRAGNSSDDCGQDGRVPFAVDLAAPSVDPNSVLVTRGAPGTPTIIEGTARAFADDVAVAELHVIDSSSGLLLASLTPQDDGALEPTSLGGTSSGRVLVETVDLLGRTSGRVAVPERWRLSLGTASTPNAAVKSAPRYSPASPRSAFMSNRTLELAPALAAADARRAQVSARVGFVDSGDLPNAFEDVFWTAAGYDDIGSAIVTFGGQKISPDGEGEIYYDRTLVLRWDDRTSTYIHEPGPAAQQGQTPSGRGAHRIAFDGNGCGIMFGGDGIRERNGEYVGLGALNDVWQICRQANGTYRWQHITPVNENGNAFPVIRRTPIIYDPAFDRYMIVGGFSNAGGLFPIGGAMFLQPGTNANDWRWDDITPLPTSFGERHSHMLYYDEALQAPAVGLGYVYPREVSDDFWAYVGGQWTSVGRVPSALDFRQGFGYAYDSARSQLVLWGDNEFPNTDASTTFLTGTATNATHGWRSVNLDPPVPRAHPTLVYDPNREVTVAFGGLRFDERFVPPTVHSIVSSPSYPYLLAEVDLAASRPKGIAELALAIRATGYGDGDGVGPRRATAGGVRVMLWDHTATEWVEVANEDTPAGGTVAEIAVRVTDRPERFVSSDGVVPVTVVTRWPGTDDVASQLEVDVIDGWLTMRPGVVLP